MRLSRIINISLLVLFALPQACRADDREQLPKVLEVLKSVRSMTTYGYHYQVKNIYPGNQEQTISGDACIDLPRKMLWEKGAYSTTILTDKWYYKAEHEQQLVSVIYLPGQDKEAQLGSLYAALSLNSAFLQDSTIERYGKILSFSVQHNIVSVKMKFRNLPALDTYELVFDLARNLPVSILVRTFYAGFGGNTVQEIRCSRFRKEIPADCFSVQPYFEIKSGAVALKQYKNYKRHIEL
ncbi:MAG: hypothetical protein JNL13_06810 [Chitinophagaceae bacterium]|nr:hypothetical protein [Chitinophagaceae bacterium]